CTGVGGDLSDRLLGMLRRRGTPIAEINSRNVTREELYDLKTQRNIANEFMRKAADLTLHELSRAIKNVNEKVAAMPEKQRSSEEARKMQAHLFMWRHKQQQLLERI